MANGTFLTSVMALSPCWMGRRADERMTMWFIGGCGIIFLIVFLFRNFTWLPLSSCHSRRSWTSECVTNGQWRVKFVSRFFLLPNFLLFEESFIVKRKKSSGEVLRNPLLLYSVCRIFLWIIINGLNGHPHVFSSLGIPASHFISYLMAWWCSSDQPHLLLCIK